MENHDPDPDRLPKSYGLGIAIILLMAAVIAAAVYGLMLFNRYKEPAVRSAVERLSPAIPARSYDEMRAMSDRLDLLRAAGDPLYEPLARAYNAEMERTGGRYTRSADLPDGEIYVLPSRYPPPGKP